MNITIDDNILVKFKIEINNRRFGKAVKVSLTEEEYHQHLSSIVDYFVALGYTVRPIKEEVQFWFLPKSVIYMVELL